MTMSVGKAQGFRWGRDGGGGVPGRLIRKSQHTLTNSINEYPLCKMKDSEGRTWPTRNSVPGGPLHIPRLRLGLTARKSLTQPPDITFSQDRDQLQILSPSSRHVLILKSVELT